MPRGYQMGTHKNKKASKIPLYEDGEGYQFEYIHKQ